MLLCGFVHLWLHSPHAPALSFHLQFPRKFLTRVKHFIVISSSYAISSDHQEVKV